MPYDPETGEWIEDEFTPASQKQTVSKAGYDDTGPYQPTEAEYAAGRERIRALQRARATEAAWEEAEASPPYSPTSEQEFRRASMSPGPSAPQGPTVDDRPTRFTYGDGPQVIERDDFGRAIDPRTGQPAREIPASAFRAFEPGGDTGTLESPYQDFEQSNAVRAAHFQRQQIQGQGIAEMQPAQRIAQLEAVIQQLTPSPAQRIQYQREDNARAQIETQVALGLIDQNTAQQALQTLDRVAQPRRMSMMLLPLTRANLQMEQLRLQNAQVAAITQQNEAFNAMTAQDRVQTVRLPDGRTVSLLADRSGHFTVLNDIADRQQQQREQRATERTQAAHDREVSRWDRLRHQAEVAVNREITQARRDIDEGNTDNLPPWIHRTPRVGPPSPIALPTQEQTETEIRRRTQASFGGPSPLEQPNAQAENGARVQQPAQQPRPIPDDAQPETLPQDQRAFLHELTALRQRVLQNHSLSAEQLAGADRVIGQMDSLYRRYGSLAAMPADAQRTFNDAAGFLDRLVASRAQRDQQIRRVNSPAQQSSTPFGSGQPGFIGGR